MTTRSFGRKTIAAILALSFPLMTSFAAGGPTASLSGRLLAAGTLAPLSGARLHLQDAAHGTFFASNRSGTDGKFDVASLPPSSYKVAVESDGRLYVVDAPLRLGAGEARRLQLAVRGADSAARGHGKASSGSSGGATAWRNPLTATLIVVGAAIVVGVIVDSATSNEQPASPFR